MKTALIAGMLVCVIGCVFAGLAGLAVLALGASLGGLAVFAVAIEHSRPKHWPRAEIEQDRHD